MTDTPGDDVAANVSVDSDVPDDPKDPDDPKGPEDPKGPDDPKGLDDFKGPGDPKSAYGPIDDDPEPPLNIVSRREWRAQLTKAEYVEWLPVPYVVLDHNTDVDSCFTPETCAATVRNIQERHMNELNEPDIQYNFLIGEDCNVYEGRGWNAKSSKKLKGSNLLPHRYDIGYIGRHDPDIPVMEIYDTLKKLLRFAKENKYLAEDFAVVDITNEGNISKYFLDIYTKIFHYLSPTIQDIRNITLFVSFRKGMDFQGILPKKVSGMRQLNLSSNEYLMHYDRWTWDDQKNDAADELPKNVSGGIKQVRFTHTQTETCLNREDCTAILRDLCSNDVKLGLKDIRYKRYFLRYAYLFEPMMGVHRASLDSDCHPSCNLIL